MKETTDDENRNMKDCKKLREYAAFVGTVRKEQAKGHGLEDAIDRAVEICIDEGILKEFLLVHRAEVKEMILEDYDFEKHMALERRDAREGEIAKMASDKGFREQLFLEFGLSSD